MTRDEAMREWEGHAQQLAREELLGFTQYTYPGYRANWHHARLAAALDGVLAGRIMRLMVFMPPQHGKSELVSRRFPAYALGRNPELGVVAGSYSADLATEMSRDVQKVIDDKAYRAVFPGTRLASEKDPDLRQAAKFGVPGHDGKYISVGVGGGITGKSMDIGIIDDPVKSREEAESDAYRRRVWNWYKDDIRTRRRDDSARIVVTMTRWHEDDLAGRLLRAAREDKLADQWTVISLPAICTELKAGDPRQLDEALWPSRFSRIDLETTRVGSGSYAWSALYQQEPVPPGGGMFKRHWFAQRVPVAPGLILRRCRAWDCAATEAVQGNDPDWTVGTLLAQLVDGRWLVEHVVRVRTTPKNVDDLILQTARMDGRQVMIREEEEGGSSGKSVIAAHLRMLQGFDYAGLRSSGEKSTRWRSFAVQCEGGNVVLPVAASWEREWLDELALVPYGLHDDQADSVALAFNTLAAHKPLGPGIASILPSQPTVGAAPPGEWQRKYFGG